MPYCHLCAADVAVLQIERVGQAVREVGPQAEVSAVLKTVQDELLRNTPPTVNRKPFLAEGELLVNSNILQEDPVTDRKYYSILSGAYTLNKPVSKSVGRFFSNFPSFEGRGASFSFWFRSPLCAEGEAFCGGYILYAGQDSEKNDPCWSLWVDTDGLYYQVPPVRAIPFNFSD